jgi:peroxiredoxin Q/BCP
MSRLLDELFDIQLDRLSEQTSFVTIQACRQLEIPRFQAKLQMIKKLLILITATAGFTLWWHSAAADIPVEGKTAPAFSLPDQNGKIHALKDYSGVWTVLYFYPKDDTPGCTKEACNFRDDLHKLESLGAKVVGISVDDTDSHAKFAQKYHLPFPLLADKDGKVADSYGALTNLGLIKIAKRYTFLIAPDGKLAKVYQSVDTSRHSQQIIDDLKSLKAGK